MSGRALPSGQQHSSIERIFSAFYRRFRKGSRRKLRCSSSEDELFEDTASTAADAAIKAAPAAAAVAAAAEAATAMRVTDVESAGGGGAPGGAECAPAPLTTDGGGGGGGTTQVDLEENMPMEGQPVVTATHVASCEMEAVDDADDDSEPLPDFLTPAELQQHRVEPRNLRLFCDRLTEFVRYVQRVHDLARATYDYPAALQRRLERDLAELRAQLAAVRDAVATVQRLRAQRSAVRKEKAQVRKHLRKLREEEVREMESIVAVYDKAMFARWENVRHTHKPDALNALLNDVKGKQQAMENLSLLIQRKQAQLQGQSPSSGTGHGGDRERASATALDTTGAGGAGAGGAQVPAPTNNNNNSSSIAPNSGGAATGGSSGTGSANEDGGVGGGGGIPAPAVSSPSLNPTGIANSEDADNTPGSSSGGVGSSGGSPGSRAARAVAMGNPEFQNEMRGVLQALFGDLRLGPVANLEDIDLFAVRSSQASNRR